MSEAQGKFKELPKKQKSAKELRQYYQHTPEREKWLHILVAMELRNFGFEQIVWARNEDTSGLGMFDYCDPYEGAASLIEKLRIFGFLPPDPEEESAQKEQA